MFAVFPLNDFYLAGSWFKKQKQKQKNRNLTENSIKKIKSNIF